MCININAETIFNLNPVFSLHLLHLVKAISNFVTHNINDLGVLNKQCYQRKLHIVDDCQQRHSHKTGPDITRAHQKMTNYCPTSFNHIRVKYCLPT